ncbi:MAG: DUF2237 family protein [Paracoccaceae bacterium]
MHASLNVYGLALSPCSQDPLTGYFRNGACDTCDQDTGSHTVCVVMTAEFLAYSKYFGNDLTTPRPEHGFGGLRAGDNWCLCASRFMQAHHEGCAPLVRLNATHIRALEVIPLKTLEQYAARE